jgi:hypothetical protein
MKAYSELWKSVVFEMESSRTDFVGDWVSKDVALRHITTAYKRALMPIFLARAHVTEEFNGEQQCLPKFRQWRTSSYAVGAHADHLRKIPHIQKCMQVNRRNIFQWS